jgi:hypothetical protein
MTTKKNAAGTSAPNYWPEYVFALLWAGLVTLVWVNGYAIRTSIIGATDFKTIYASAWNLRHGIDAYRFEDVAAVLTANGVTPPPTAYGHNAVYPPFTVALLAPVTCIPLVPAIRLWCLAGWLAFSAALGGLAQAAGEEFGVGRFGRLLLVFLGVLYPVFSFATITQNVSLMAAALGLFAVTSRDRGWLRAIALAIALVLKPHLALWPALALLLLPQLDSRRVAIRAALLAAAAVVLSGAWMAFDRQLDPQLHSYLAALHAEVGSGSMSPTRRDTMAAGLQITSLSGLLGFWQLSAQLRDSLCWIALACLAAILLWAAGRTARLPEPMRERSRFLAAGAWCSLGMIATYHRAHDGLILLVLFPWLIASCKIRMPFRLLRLPLLSWATLALLLLFAAPFSFTGGNEPSNSWKLLLLYRQAPVGAAALAALLALRMVLLVRSRSPFET